MSNTALAETTLPLAPTTEVARSPMLSLLSDAIQKGMSIDVIREIKDMAKEMAADEARRAFDAALAGAKSEIKPITKNRHVGFDSKKAGASRTDYRHEDLAEIARTVDPILSKYGLSYRYKTEAKPNEPVTVTCILAHRDGHNEQNTLSAGKDESGNKNSIQAIGSTITYLQRYTLKAALGLAASNDDDGERSEEQAGDLVTDDQRDELLALIDATGTNIEAFCKFYRIDAVSDVPSKHFDKVKAVLEAKKAKQS